MRPFLTAKWLNLVVLNYEIEPGGLDGLVPLGCELDFWEGKTYVSVVGFQFLDTCILGVKVPGHSDFLEVNLRFYVKRAVGDEVRRGVVFIKEIVPLRAVQWIANGLYGENYATHPMRSMLSENLVEYGWKRGPSWECVSASPVGEIALPPPESLEEFIIEHYWGYAKRGDRTTEYRVAHPPWRVRQVEDSKLSCDPAALYGERFAPILHRPPTNALFAQGSSIEVYPGVLLK